MEDSWNYASVIGMLMYLESNSRPHTQFVVHHCSRLTHSPKKSHSEGIKRIIIYLSGTRDKWLLFKRSEELSLECYVYDDFSGIWGSEDILDPIGVISRSGYVITLGNCTVVWSSKLQSKIEVITLEV